MYCVRCSCQNHILTVPHLSRNVMPLTRSCALTTQLAQHTACHVLHHTPTKKLSCYERCGCSQFQHTLTAAHLQHSAPSSVTVRAVTCKKAVTTTCQVDCSCQYIMLLQQHTYQTAVSAAVDSSCNSAAPSLEGFAR